MKNEFINFEGHLGGATKMWSSLVGLNLPEIIQVTVVGGGSGRVMGANEMRTIKKHFFSLKLN